MIKVGIVGNGLIVQQALGCFKEAGIPCTALWCRNAEKGKPLADEYGIDRIFTDYEEFLDQDDFDTVYIGLINSLHYEYAVTALQKNKNVICEKPITSTYQEMETLRLMARDRNVFLFEAIMSRYSANYETVRDNLARIGDIKLIRANYSQYSRRYDDYQKGKVLPAFDPNLSGGALYDINVYNVHFVTGLFGRPETVTYDANIGFNGIDTSGILVLDYGPFKAVCTGAKDSASPSGITIQGTKGYIEINERPGFVRNVKLHLNDGTEEMLDGKDEGHPMTHEFRVMRRCVQEDDYERTFRWLTASLDTMYVLSEARKSAGIVFPADEK